MNIGIYGYGNLGRAAELLTLDRQDIHTVAVFTRRDPERLRTFGAQAYTRDTLPEFEGKIDCMLMCGGSFDDLRLDTPTVAERFNTVDSFDIHAKIEEHKIAVGKSAEQGNHTSVVSVGWDPGLMSLFRLYAHAAMPKAVVNTFWGRGVSQGHSEAIRRIKGVRRAVEYTVPSAEAVELAHRGLTLGEEKRHKRVCYVVADGDKQYIERTIRDMPEYFAGYETEVHFINEDEYVREHCQLPHRGDSIACGVSGVYKEHLCQAELTLEMDSNPEFTAGIMLAYAVAAVRLQKEGRYGAFTVFDVPPIYLLDTAAYL